MENQQYSLIAGSLGRIEATLNSLDERLTAHDEGDKIIHQDVEQRLRKLEGWKHYVVGISGAVALFASNIKSFIFPHTP